MKNQPIFLPDADATDRVGTVLAASLQAGDVVALCGTLGAGKTHLIKSVVNALGSSSVVTSPTFSLVHEYAGGRFPLFHFDFYRLTKSDELIDFGWDDYLAVGGLCLVEWADLFPDFMPAQTQWWRLSPCGEGRLLEFDENR